MVNMTVTLLCIHTKGKAEERFRKGGDARLFSKFPVHHYGSRPGTVEAVRGGMIWGNNLVLILKF